MTHTKVKIVYLQSSDCHNRLPLMLGIGPPIFLIWAHPLSHHWKHVALFVEC